MTTSLGSRLATAVAVLAALALLSGCSIGIPDLAGGTAHPSPTSTSFIGDDASDSPSATPAPSASPSDEFTDPDPASLYNTTWSGSESDGYILTVHFAADGTFTYTNTGVPDDPSHNETWKLEGMKITMSFNDDFAIRQGLLDDNTMNGSASNTKGESWTWTMTKQK
ncbi:MAG: hypothetical protein ABIP33_02305 [Pseudolysinimonas sp.]